MFTKISNVAIREQCMADPKTHLHTLNIHVIDDERRKTAPYTDLSTTGQSLSRGRLSAVRSSVPLKRLQQAQSCAIDTCCNGSNQLQSKSFFVSSTERHQWSKVMLSRRSRLIIGRTDCEVLSRPRFAGQGGKGNRPTSLEVPTYTLGMVLHRTYLNVVRTSAGVRKSVAPCHA